MVAEFAFPRYQLDRADLAEISLPMLIISGTNSLPSFRAVARVLADAVPSARLLELTGSGHVTYFEKPDDFARSVAAFATAVAGRTSRSGLH